MILLIFSRVSVHLSFLFRQSSYNSRPWLLLQQVFFIGKINHQTLSFWWLAYKFCYSYYDLTNVFRLKKIKRGAFGGLVSLRSIYLVCSNNTDHQDHHEYCCCDLPSFDFCSNPTCLIETGPQRIERDSNANNLPEPHDLESQQHHKYKTWTGKSAITIYL